MTQMMLKKSLRRENLTVVRKKRRITLMRSMKTKETKRRMVGVTCAVYTVVSDGGFVVHFYVISLC